MASNQGNKQGGNPGSNRGFAGMDPERQRAIAAEGGRAAHASGNAHQFTSEEARQAGAKRQGGAAQGGLAQDGTGRGGSQQTGATRGGASEPPAHAGRESHKNG